MAAVLQALTPEQRQGVATYERGAQHAYAEATAKIYPCTNPLRAIERLIKSLKNLSLVVTPWDRELPRDIVPRRRMLVVAGGMAG